MSRTLAQVVADLRNALTPVCLLPHEIAVDFLTEDGREAVAGAKASLPRVHALLDELSAHAGPSAEVGAIVAANGVDAARAARAKRITRRRTA